MFKVFLVILCFSGFITLSAQNLNLIFYDGFDSKITDVAIARDSTLVLSTYEKLSDTEFVGKVFKSTDLGNNWDLIWKRESTEEMKPYYTYYWNYLSAVSKDIIVIFNSSGYISRTFDGGLSWDSTKVIDSETAQISCFKKKKNQIAFVFETSDQLIYSNDYGTSWNYSIVPTVQADQLDPIAIALEGDNRFTVANSNTYFSKDGEHIKQVVLDHFDSGAWVNQKTIYDLGIVEMDQLISGSILAFSIYPDSVVAANNYKLGSYKLLDKYYQLRGNLLPKTLMNYSDWKPTIFSYDNKLLVTCQDTIWYTKSNGASWQYFTKDDQQPFPGTKLDGGDMLDNGLGLYKDSKSVYLFNPNPTSVNDSKTEDNSISIYPNPSSDFVSITSEEEGLEEIILFDVQGREVGRFDVGSKIQDVSYLESGTYYLRFSYKDKIKIRQLVISR